MPLASSMKAFLAVCIFFFCLHVLAETVLAGTPVQVNSLISSCCKLPIIAMI